MKEFIYIVEEYECSDYCGIASARGIIGAYKELETAKLMVNQLKKENGKNSGLIVTSYVIELQ